MKNILVTTDLSAEASASFGVAKKIASAFDAQIHILAIIEDPAQAAMVYALDFPVLPNPDVREQLAQKVAGDLAEISQAEFGEIDHRNHVIEASGPVHIEISNFVRANDIDLVVIATHGHTGLSRILIGSVAERVVRECPCPVLTVRSDTTDKK